MARKINPPAKGSIIAVSPIRDTEDIARIKKLLATSPRDLALFTLGVNNGLRVGDLLSLKVGEVKTLKPGDTLNIREKKTGKPNILMINKAGYKALTAYLAIANLQDTDYLFKSRKGENQPLSVAAVNHMIKDWCKTLGIKGNYGSHSLRKTFGYIQRVRFGVAWEILCRRFNHSNPSVTIRYLGIEDKEVNGILLNEI